MPDPVPAVPDLTRQTTYSPVASAGPFDVGFDVYGSGTDYGAWIRVFLDGEELVSVTDWVLTSATGTLATIARPITDAQVAPVSGTWTGDLIILGQERPRRTTQLTEGRPVSARDFNLIASKFTVQAREFYDRMASAEAAITAGLPTLDASKAVLVDRLQTFTDAETARARGNIDLAHIVTPQMNGVVADGLADAATIINTLIASTAAAGQLLYIPAGEYLLSSDYIKLVSGANVWCEDGAVFVVGKATGGVFGIVSQTSFAAKIENVRWRGGSIVNPDDFEFAGFGFYGDNVHIDGLAIDNVILGLVGGFSGDNNRISNIYARTAIDGTNPGGIRNWGGFNNRVTDCNVISEDDCYQFAPSGSAQVLDQPIGDSLFINCVGGSDHGRFLLANLVNPSLSTASIKRVGFVGCRGVAGRFISVQNTFSTGTLEDVSFVDCSCDLSGSDTDGRAVEIVGEAGNLVKGVHFVNTRVIAPNRIGLFIGGNVEDVQWNGGRIDAPRVAGEWPVRIDNCTGGSIRNTRITANGDDGMRIGVSAATDVVGFVIENNRIDEIADLQAGVLVTGGAYVRLGRNTVKKASGATTSIGLTLSAGTANCTIDADNDLSGVDTPITVSGSADNTGNIVYRPDFVEVYANDNTMALAVTNSRNIQHTAVLTADRSATLPTTNVVEGDEFTIVRTGSGAFNLNVGTGPLAALKQNHWCRVKYEGAAWYLVAFGTLSIQDSAYGGTGNGFTKFTGPATSEKTFTLPNSSDTILTAGVTANLTAGFTTTSFSNGTKSSGTFTPNAANGGIQHYTNGGAHTLAPPSSACTIILEVTNASAGAITTSGFSVVSGDAYDSSGTKKHIFYITKTNSFSELNIRYVTGT